MAITYKTVLAEAIRGYNNIQDTLHNFNATQAGVLTYDGTNAVNKIDSTTTANLVKGSLTPAQLTSAISRLAVINTDNTTNNAVSTNGKNITGVIAYRGSVTTTVNPTLSGTVVSYSRGYSAGYYTGGTISGSLNLGKAEATTSTVTPTNGTVTPSIGGKITDIATTSKPTTGTDGTDYWTIDPGASITTQPSAKATVTVSKGYTTGFTVEPSTNVTPSIANGTNYYIKKGSVTSSASITATTLTPGTNGITLLESAPSGTAETDYFTLKPYATASSSMSLTVGYIPSTGNASGAEPTTKKTYYVKKATVSAESVTPTNGTVTPSIGGKITDITTTTAPSGTATEGTDYWTINPGASITSQPSASASITVTEGYTKGFTESIDSVNVTPTIANGTNRYLLKGVITPSIGVSDNIPDTTYSGVTTTTLTTTQPSGTNGTDYYTVNITPSYTNTAGYNVAHSTAVTTTAVPYYIQKALFKYLDNDNKVIECTRSGFVSSGSLAVTGTLDTAAITCSLFANTYNTSTKKYDTNANILMSSDSGTSGYKIISNHTIDAGFISATSGTIDFSSEYYIRKGSVTSSASITSATIGAGTNASGILLTSAPSGTNGTDYYTFTAKARASSSMSFTAGYIPSKGTEGSMSSDSNGTSYYLKKGSVSSSASITATTLTPGTNGITLVETAPSGTAEIDYFTLKPYATASSSMSFTAGYIPSKGTASGASSTTKKTYYVKKATVSAESVTPTNGSITPSIGGKITSITTTTKPSGTDGTDYWTIDPGASITSQPKASASITVTEGYTKGFTETVDAVNVTPTINAGTNRYIKAGSISSELSGDATTFTNSSGSLEMGNINKNISVTTGYIASSSKTITSGYAHDVDEYLFEAYKRLVGADYTDFTADDTTIKTTSAYTNS